MFRRFQHVAYALILAMALAHLYPAASAAQGDPPQATAAASAEPADELKSAEELETLVARFALYPDDLVALVMASSLFPLEIVQAGRFLDKAASDKDLKPDADWDGSVISLLNYPDIIKMMNDDLSWTQDLGEAVTNQQEDVLVAIQQLRDKAVADGVIKTDDKVVIETTNNNVVIRPAKEEVTYVPQYDPAILVEPGYVATSPIIYGDPWPSYYYPYAPYWTGFITGAVWGAAVDWDRWHSWGGDVDIDVDVDIDRDRFKFDRDNIGNMDWNRDRGDINIDRNSIKNNVQVNGGNRLDRKTNTEIKNTIGNRVDAGNRTASKDVRRDVSEGLKKRDGSPGIAGKDPGDGRPGAAASRPAPKKPANVQRPAARPSPKKAGPAHAAKAQRPKAKPAAKVDHRPKHPSAMGDYGRGRDVQRASHRGHASKGGGRRGHGGGGGGQRIIRR